jgi:signal transduction histidine kinase
VEADQARIAGDLDEFLRDRVDQIAAAAAAGRQRLAADPDEARETFVAIQDTGRETLTHLRDVVAGLHDPAATGPQPVLAQLDRLVGEATHANARLRVTGDPRLLPPGVELSGYRIVEHLLVALERDPSVDVELAFGAETLTLTVAGPGSHRADVQAALAAATERAVMHGGTLRTRTTGAWRETVVRIPLANAHA